MTTAFLTISQIRIGDKEKPWVDWLDTIKKKWARKMVEVRTKLD